MQNRLFCFILVFSLLVSCFTVNASSVELSISADSAIVMIADTNEVVYSKNPDKKRGIASTTKIMSAIIALESKKLYSDTVVKKEDIMVEGTSMGLKVGDCVSLMTLVKGMLISSGNDAANVTATFVSGGKEHFAELMNKKAHSLGMTSSNFRNPSGLTEEGHYSTAYDMALLGSYAVKNPVFCSICTLDSCSVFYGSRGAATLYNHNKFLKMYDGAFGIKTGFTKASGRCLVTAVNRDGVTLVCVTLNAPDDWQDHKKLYDYSFERIKTFELAVSTPSVRVVGGKKISVSTELSREISVPYVYEKPQIKTEFYIEPFLYGGLKSGDVVGLCEIFVHNKRCYSIAIVSVENSDVLLQEKSNNIVDIIKEILRKGLSKRQT